MVHMRPVPSRFWLHATCSLQPFRCSSPGSVTSFWTVSDSVAAPPACVGKSLTYSPWSCQQAPAAPLQAATSLQKRPASAVMASL